MKEKIEWCASTTIMAKNKGKSLPKNTWCTPITFQQREIKQKCLIDLPQVLKDPTKEKIKFRTALNKLSYIIKIIFNIYKRLTAKRG